jgi:hypothetical protein
MDLLGNFCKKERDSRNTDQKSLLETYWWYAKTVLLGRMFSSIVSFRATLEYMKKILLVVGLLVVLFGTCYYFMTAKQQPPTDSGVSLYTKDITYTNKEYGFTLTLPSSWKGFTVTTGPIKSGSGQGTGILVTLRNPKWTKEKPTMDIPIQVFTQTQWNIWENNHFETYPTAAPIGPTKRGNNTSYVFATAPRYNYSYLPGFEEVETIIQTLKGL